jgi:hypothetical protein
MPKYRRYGYIIHQKNTDVDRRIVDAEVIGFLLNPKKAYEAVDIAVKSLLRAYTGAKVVSDAMETVKTGSAGEDMRTVLIEYPDGSHTALALERWYVVVGKE